MGGVGQVGLEDEYSVGGVGGSCIGFIVDTTGLSAVNCKSSGYEAVGLFLEEYLAEKEYCLILNRGAGENFD